MSNRLNRFAQAMHHKLGAWASSPLSNYILLVLRLVSVFVMTRSLFMNLSSGEYSFWALLWAVFGYTLLLDFGFGTAVQKMTSQTRVSGDWGQFAQMLSALRPIA